MSTEFSQYLISRGTVHQRSCAYTPGIAERKNRYLLERVRAMMFGMNLVWVEAVLTATYLINRIPSKFLLEASLITLILKYLAAVHILFFLVSLKKASQERSHPLLSQ